jgi:hypothetical protein
LDVLAVLRLFELYPGICLTTEEKARKTSVAARTSQADTVQYKNNEQYNTRKMSSTIQRIKTATPRFI